MSDKRFSWTQPCCDDCWEERHPGRTASTVNDADKERCVFCDAETQSGIYVRIDPAIAPHPTLTEEMSDDKPAEPKPELPISAPDAILGRSLSPLDEALPYLRRPFTPGAIKWKIQSTWPKNPPKQGAVIIGYIDARLVEARLNKVVGGNWEEEPVRVEGQPNALLCKLTVFTQTHVDIGIGQGRTEEMKLKAVHSDSLKRVAVRFGIGESLYAMPEFRLPVTDDGAEQSDGTPTIKRRKDGEPSNLQPRHYAWLRKRYEDWLRAEGEAAFGEPLDHGDAAEGSVGEAESQAESEATAPQVPEPMADEEGRGLIEQAETLRDEIQQLDPGALGNFDNVLKQRWHAADVLREFIEKLEGLRRDLERFIALEDQARSELDESEAKKLIDKAMRRGSRAERVEVLEKALDEAKGESDG